MVKDTLSEAIIIGGVKVDLFGLQNKPKFSDQIPQKVMADFQKIMPKGYCISLPKSTLFCPKSAHLCSQILPSHHKIFLFFCQKFPNKTSSPQPISLLLPMLNDSVSLS